MNQDSGLKVQEIFHEAVEEFHLGLSPDSLWRKAQRRKRNRGIFIVVGSAASLVLGGVLVPGILPSTPIDSTPVSQPSTPSAWHLGSEGTTTLVFDSGEGTPWPSFPENAPINNAELVSGLDNEFNELLDEWHILGHLDGNDVVWSEEADFNPPELAAGTVIRFSRDVSEQRVLMEVRIGSCQVYSSYLTVSHAEPLVADDPQIGLRNSCLDQNEASDELARQWQLRLTQGFALSSTDTALFITFQD